MIRYLTISVCCVVFGQHAPAQLRSDIRPVPASIHEISIDSCTVLYGTTRVTGQLVTRAVGPTHIFYLRVLLSLADSTFWAWGSFKIVCSLPSRETREYRVSSFDFRPVRGGFAEVPYTVSCNVDGWAVFTLAPTESATESNVNTYLGHSNLRTVLLRCSK